VHSIARRPGFDWTLVNWGGPDEPRTEHCSYCGDALGEESVPLILWNAGGWCAEFCDHCQAAWWGMQTFDEPGEPRLEPEAAKPRNSI
jgi:hypothetical protein